MIRQQELDPELCSSQGFLTLLFPLTFLQERAHQLVPTPLKGEKMNPSPPPRCHPFHTTPYSLLSGFGRKGAGRRVHLEHLWWTHKQSFQADGLRERTSIIWLTNELPVRYLLYLASSLSSLKCNKNQKKKKVIVSRSLGNWPLSPIAPCTFPSKLLWGLLLCLSS